jgi:hypothetical protein
MDIQSVIERAKNSKYFEVKITLDSPLEFRDGYVPFDIKADGQTAVFNVLAKSYDEAELAVHEWMNGN